MAGKPAPNLTVERHPEVDVIRLFGEHDMATEQSLTQAIGAAIASDHGVVVSLVDAEFIDSTVINAIFMGDRLLRKRNGRRLAIHLRTSSIVRRALEIGSVCEAILCASELHEAIAYASDPVKTP